MTLYSLIKTIKRIASNLPNISFVHEGDVYELNKRADIEYPAIVITQNSHRDDMIEDNEYYGLTIFAIDRLTSDSENKLDIQSWANELLKGLIFQIEELNLGMIMGDINIQPFTERFESLCAGCYAQFQVQLTDMDCEGDLYILDILEKLKNIKKITNIYDLIGAKPGSLYMYSEDAEIRHFSIEEVKDFEVGETTTMKVLDIPYKNTITWSVDDESIATINTSNGKLSGLKEGKVRVVAKSSTGIEESVYIEVGKATVGYENGTKWVDLGLPSGKKWTMDPIGISSKTAYGDYFMWGDTQSKSNYLPSSYRWMKYDTASYNEEWYKINKYQWDDNSKGAIWYDSSGRFIGDNKIKLDVEDDIISNRLKGRWRMPTKEEFQELIDNCDVVFSGGVDVYFKSKHNKRILHLYLAGYKYSYLDKYGRPVTNTYSTGSTGTYLSSNGSPDSSVRFSTGLYLYQNGREVRITNGVDRFSGFNAIGIFEDK